MVLQEKNIHAEKVNKGKWWERK